MMAQKRMVLEIGMGTDIRGGDPTKAACRALRDALWHNSLSIATALGQPLDAMIVVSEPVVLALMRVKGRARGLIGSSGALCVTGRKRTSSG